MGTVTATDAANRLGQMLEHAQRMPVDRYGRCKAWVDAENARFERLGLRSREFRNR